MTKKLSNMIHYNQKNFYYDPLYDILWPKKILLWSIMTHYDKIISHMNHYVTLWPKKIYIMIHSMTYYDQKKFYYDPLWHTMTQKKFLLWSTLWHTMTKIISNMIHYDTLWPKKFLIWSTLWHSMIKTNFYYDRLYDTLWPKHF